MKGIRKRAGLWTLIVALAIINVFGAIGAGNASAEDGETHWLTFKYDDFTGADQNDTLSINNSAAVYGSALRLTAATQDQTGSVFNQSRIYSTNHYSFSTYFKFQMSEQGKSPNFQPGADGITFTIQTQASNAGTIGSGIGYGGIAPSFAVKFDTFQNGELGDPSDNYIGLALNGDVENTNSTWYVDIPKESYDMKDGNVHYTWIDYDGAAKRVEVRISNTPARPAGAVLAVDSINLDTVFNGQPGVYAGFTAATGSSWENHDLLQWYFTNKYDPIDATTGNYVQAPTDVDVTTEPYGIPGKTVLIARALDPSGNPVPGVPVTFDPEIGSIDDLDGKPPTKPAVVLTDSDGYAKVVLDTTQETSGGDVTVVAEGGAYAIIHVPTVPSSAPTISDETWTGATLSWNAAAGANAYNVYDNGVLVKTVDADTSVTLTDLDPRASHSFTVTALNDSYESAPSPSADVPAKIAIDAAGGTLTVRRVDPSYSVSVYQGDKLLGSGKNDGGASADVTVSGLDLSGDGPFTVKLTDGSGQPVGDPYVIESILDKSAAPAANDVAADAAADTVTVRGVPPGATVAIYDKTTGKLLGTATNAGDAPAEVSVAIDSGLNPGQLLQVKVQETGKSWSDPVDVTVAGDAGLPEGIIFNQSGLSYSGTIAAHPLEGNVAMTGYGDWPDGASTASYSGSVFDGRNIWLIPSFETAVIRFDTQTGTMSTYADWPGDHKGFEFSGGVFDGRNIWLVPTYGDAVVKLDTQTGEMTEDRQWPNGFTPSLSQSGSFKGGVFDGQNIWLIPSYADRLIKIDKDTGAMTGYQDWPDGFVQDYTKGSFIGGVFDGRNIWLVPASSDRVIKVDTATGAMTGYDGWPSGFTPSLMAGNDFNGGVFDGQYVWFVPYLADRVIKLDTVTGAMTGYDGWPAGFDKEQGTFQGGVFDGKYVWLVPAAADRVVRLDTATGEMTGYDGWPSGLEKDLMHGFTGGVFDGQNVWLTPGTAGQIVKLSLAEPAGKTDAPAAKDITADGTNNRVIVRNVPPGATIRIYDAAGNLLGTATNTGSEAGTLAIDGLEPSISGLGTIKVTMEQPGHPESDPVEVPVAASSAAPQPDDVVTDSAAQTVTVDNVPPGATVTVYDRNGNEIGHAVNGGTAPGPVTVTMPDSVHDGDSLTVTVTEPGKSESSPVGVVYEATDEQELAEAAKRLQVGYVDGDTWESVTSPVLLVTAGAFDTSVSWTSSRPDVVSIGDPTAGRIAAQVTRQSRDTSVILTATLEKNAKTQIKTFLLIVKAQGSTKEVDAAHTRNVEVRDQTNASVSVPVTRINVTHEDQSVSKIDKVILTADKTRETVKNAGADGNEATIVIDEPAGDAPDEIAVEVPAESVALLAANGFRLHVQTAHATVSLDASQLKQLSGNGQALYFHLVPIRDQLEQAQVKGRIPQVYMGQTVAPLGTPLELETNYSGYSTVLFVSFASNGIDPAVVNVDNVRLYIEHTDGEQIMSEGTIVKDDNGNPAGLAVSIDKFSTFTFAELTSGGSNAATPATSSTTTVQAQVQIGAGDSSFTLPVDLTRIVDADGTVTDSLTLTGEQAQTAVEHAQAAGADKIVIVIPDDKDEVSSTTVRLDQAAADRFAAGNIGVEVATAGGSLSIPASSLANAQGAVSYTLTPVKDAAAQQALLASALQSDAVKTWSAGGEPTAVGRSLRLSTGDAAMKPAALILPLKGVVVPADEQGRAELLARLAVYADYGNGQGELLHGTIVRMADGSYGLLVNAAKPGAYTLLIQEPSAQGKHHAYVHGYPDGTFRPDRPVTRAEMASMLAQNLPDAAERANATFTDVRDGYWAAGSIAKVAAAGIMQGDPDGRFRPDDSLTRAEMAALAAKYLKLEAAETPGDSHAFGDVKGHWAAAAIDAVFAAGAMKGYPDGTFRPDSRLTRAEAVAAINRLFHRGPLYGTDGPIWPDVPVAHWAYGNIEEASLDHGYVLRQDGSEQIVK